MDPENLAEAGWGLVVAEDTSAEILEALTALRCLRAQQAGDRYREFTGRKGCAATTPNVRS